MACRGISRRDFLKAMAAASALTIGSGAAGCVEMVSSAGDTIGNWVGPVPGVERSARIALKDCMGAKPGERVLIVTDSLRKDLGMPLYDAALQLGCDASYLEMKLHTRSGEEPPGEVALAMQDTDVAILATRYSLTHTEATRNACANGARIGSMPIQSEDSELVRRVFSTGGITANLPRMKKMMRNLVEQLESISEIRVTTEQGTDITFELHKGFWMCDTGTVTAGGGLTNLPGGEVLTVPVDASGVAVIDGSFGDYGLLKSPLELTIENGYCTGAQGDRADDLNELFAKIGPDARNVAELGIGMNPKAQLCGIILEDEKAIGTIHIALGDNANIGGNVHVPIHFDGIVTSPHIEAEGKTIDLSDYQ
ncbi:MAG: Thermophilic metalloprotease (M29) [Methanocella sp. PtaU1.Bin125]|nr:MAG: Thermophilic metalloprotease (M29) [Methanocella sp. PtaU1.Bin125]